MNLSMSRSNGQGIGVSTVCVTKKQRGGENDAKTLESLLLFLAVVPYFLQYWNDENLFLRPVVEKWL